MAQAEAKANMRLVRGEIPQTRFEVDGAGIMLTVGERLVFNCAAFHTFGAGEVVIFPALCKVGVVATIVKIKLILEAAGREGGNKSFRTASAASGSSCAG